jgi:hypothetical protein
MDPQSAMRRAEAAIFQARREAIKPEMDWAMGLARTKLGHEALVDARRRVIAEGVHLISQYTYANVYGLERSYALPFGLSGGERGNPMYIVAAARTNDSWLALDYFVAPQNGNDWTDRSAKIGFITLRGGHKIEALPFGHEETPSVLDLPAEFDGTTVGSSDLVDIEARFALHRQTLSAMHAGLAFVRVCLAAETPPQAPS